MSAANPSAIGAMLYFDAKLPVSGEKICVERPAPNRSAQPARHHCRFRPAISRSQSRCRILMCVSREAGLEITPPTFRKNTFVSTGVDVLFGQNVIDVFFA